MLVGEAVGIDDMDLIGTMFKEKNESAWKFGWGPETGRGQQDRKVNIVQCLRIVEDGVTSIQ